MSSGLWRNTKAYAPLPHLSLLRSELPRCLFRATILQRGEGSSEGDEFGTGLDDEIGVVVCSNTITKTALKHSEWEETVLLALDSLNVSFGQYDQEELALFHQRLDEHFREAENARSVDLDMAASIALLSGDIGDGFEPAQEGQLLFRWGRRVDSGSLAEEERQTPKETGQKAVTSIDLSGEEQANSHESCETWLSATV